MNSGWRRQWVAAALAVILVTAGFTVGITRYLTERITGRVAGTVPAGQWLELEEPGFSIRLDGMQMADPATSGIFLLVKDARLLRVDFTLKRLRDDPEPEACAIWVHNAAGERLAHAQYALDMPRDCRPAKAHPVAVGEEFRMQVFIEVAEASPEGMTVSLHPPGAGSEQWELTQ